LLSHFLPRKRDQHHFRQVRGINVAEHVDNLRRGVLRVRAKV
jgi:hypothetical protein